MSQTRDMAEKKRVFWDNVEVEGLVSIGEIPLEKGTLDVPEFDRIRTVQNGVSRMPPVDMTYKVSRNGVGLTFFRNFYNNNQVKDCIVVRCDAGGQEFARTLLSSCECVRYVEPPYDAANPQYAVVTIRVLPWEVTPVAGA